MERPFSQKRLLISILAMTMAVVLASRLLHSDSQSGTALVVRVQPEVLMEADAPPSWDTAGELQKLPILLKVMIRLNSGTTGELSIYSAGEAASEASPLQVETEAGLRQITATPVVLRNYSASGADNQTVLIQRALSEGNDLLRSSVILQLISSDGAIAVSRVITLPPTASPEP